MYDECTNYGIGGLCGSSCPMYLDGRCATHDEIAEYFEDPEELAEYLELYVYDDDLSSYKLFQGE